MIARALQSGIVLLLILSPIQSLASEVGIKVGSTVADFSLPDQSGKNRKFSDIASDGPVAIVFHRSADW